MAIFRWRPSLARASNTGGVGTKRDFRRIAGYRSITAAMRTTTATVHRAVQFTAHTATSMNLCLSQHERPRRREDNRTEFICTQR